MQRVKRVFEIINKIQSFIASAALFLLAMMIMVQVLLRYVFRSPLFGIEEAEIFPMIWVYFLGGAIASYEKSHIQCGIFSVITKNKRVLYWADLVKDIVYVVFSVIICTWTFDYFLYCLNKGQESALLNIPMILAEGMIFVSMVLVSLFALRDLLDFGERKKILQEEC